MNAAYGWHIASRAWIAMPPPIIMGFGMLAWPRVPWPFVAGEWALALCFGVLSLVGRRAVRRGR